MRLKLRKPNKNQIKETVKATETKLTKPAVHHTTSPDGPKTQTNGQRLVRPAAAAEEGGRTCRDLQKAEHSFPPVINQEESPMAGGAIVAHYS